MTQSEINKLHRSIATDFKLVTRKTELWTLQRCYDILHDIKKLMSFQYIETVSIVLQNSSYSPLKAKKYIIISTSGTQNDRPGNIDWEDDDGQMLDAIITYTESYKALSADERIAFQKDNFRSQWFNTSTDPNFPHLIQAPAKTYAHENSGVSRVDFN